MYTILNSLACGADALMNIYDAKLKSDSMQIWSFKSVVTITISRNFQDVTGQ